MTGSKRWSTETSIRHRLHRRERGTTVDDPNFTYDVMAPDEAMPKPSDVLVPIVSEWDGGVIGYALGRDHAEAMTAGLNQPWAEQEYKDAMKRADRL